MTSTALRAAALAVLCALTPLAAQAQAPGEGETRARALAEAQDFAGALAVLDAQPATARQRYSHRFLRARILGWSGAHGEARAALDRLLAENPRDVDVRLARGQVAFYAGELDAAEADYRAVLAAAPDYQDARNGLDAVARARQGERSTQPRWRFDSAVGLSTFDSDNGSDPQDWDNQFARAELRTDSLGLAASVQRFSRFGLSDIELGAEVLDGRRGGWEWAVQGGVTLEADFRPDYTLGGSLGRAMEMEDGTVLVPSLLYRLDDYQAGAIHNIQPALTAYFTNGVEFEGRIIGTLQSDAPDLFGALGRIRVPLNSQLSATAGVAQAPEAVNGLAVDTTSVFGGLGYALSDDVEVRFDLGWDDRENVWQRTHGSIGLVVRR